MNPNSLQQPAQATHITQQQPQAMGTTDYTSQDQQKQPLPDKTSYGGSQLPGSIVPHPQLGGAPPPYPIPYQQQPQAPMGYGGPTMYQSGPTVNTNVIVQTAPQAAPAAPIIIHRIDMPTCCCFDIVTGTWIIGILRIIWAVFTIIFYFAMGTVGVPAYDYLNSSATAMEVFFVAAIVALFWGLLTKTPIGLVPYMIVQLISMAVYAIGFIIVLVALFSSRALAKALVDSGEFHYVSNAKSVITGVGISSLVYLSIAFFVQLWCFSIVKRCHKYFTDCKSALIA